MTLKKLIFTLIAVFAFGNVFSQDKLSVYINNKMAGETAIPESPIVLSLSKAKYKNVSKLTVKYQSQNPTSPYKRSIAVTDGNENSLYSLDETKGGVYNIDLSPVRKKLLIQKTIKVFLLENPVNDRMSIPSRRKLLIELHLK